MGEEGVGNGGAGVGRESGFGERVFTRAVATCIGAHLLLPKLISSERTAIIPDVLMYLVQRARS